MRKQLFATAYAVVILATPVFCGATRSVESIQCEIGELKKEVDQKNARIAELLQELEKALKERANPDPVAPGIPVDLAKLKQFSSITINEKTSIKIGAVQKKKRTNLFDRYDDRYFYCDADKDNCYITFDFTVTSKEKDLVLPALYVGRIDGGEVTDIKPFVVRLHGWSSHGCYICLYHDSKNDFAKKDAVRFVAFAEVPDDGKTRVVFTDKIGMYMRTEKEHGRPCVAYEPLPTRLASGKLLLNELASGYVLIKIIK